MTTRIDFSAGGPEQELKIEKRIVEPNGDVTDMFAPAGPLVFGRYAD